MSNNRKPRQSQVSVSLKFLNSILKEEDQIRIPKGWYESFVTPRIVQAYSQEKGLTLPEFSETEKLPEKKVDEAFDSSNVEEVESQEITD
tara:strand:+ start:57089 stop:57358 length:270 start_codon:yes stop_codon:yes gene_type:complete